MKLFQKTANRLLIIQNTWNQSVSLLGLLLVMNVYTVCAQSNGESVRDALQALSSTYAKVGSISFDIEYTCSNPDHPEEVIDSLRGSLHMVNGKYCYHLDQTTSIATGAYTINLFPEDNIMLLSKPGKSPSGLNPMATIDSLLLHQDITGAVRIDGNLKIIEIQCGSQFPARKIRYEIDNRTGWIERVVSVVNASELYDETVQPLLTTEGKTALVTMAFSHYSKRRGNDSDLQAGTYFKKEGAAFIAVAPYDQYKIILGTPDL